MMQLFWLFFGFIVLKLVRQQLHLVVGLLKKQDISKRQKEMMDIKKKVNSCTVMYELSEILEINSFWKTFINVGVDKKNFKMKIHSITELRKMLQRHLIIIFVALDSIRGFHDQLKQTKNNVTEL